MARRRRSLLPRLVASLPYRHAVGASVPHDKISVTVERPALAEVRGITKNLSAFFNDALKEKLYFRHLEEEAARLESEGVPLSPRGANWIAGQIAHNRKRLKRR